MNWDAIGAIAELLGAIGVIASLVYLATQIRHSREQMSQNTRGLRAASYQQFSQDLDSRFWRLVETPALEAAVSMGMVDFHRLSEEDSRLFKMWTTGIMKSYENAYYQFRVGLLDEDRWRMHRLGLEQVFESSGVIQWASPRRREENVIRSLTRLAFSWKPLQRISSS